MAAIVGGGRRASPGEISLAHNGVLFMDEFPEYGRAVLETLRQPIETGTVMVARANAHVSYPCRFMLIAAANPCRCGEMFDPNKACSRAPICGEDYLGRISGPLMDRFDLRLEIPPVSFQDLDLPANGESSVTIAARVGAARDIQSARYAICPAFAPRRYPGRRSRRDRRPRRRRAGLSQQSGRENGAFARGYHRILRVARTIADLDGAAKYAALISPKPSAFAFVR